MIVLQYYDLGDLGNRVGDSTEALELESISFGLMKLVRPRPHQFNIQIVASSLMKEGGKEIEKTASVTAQLRNFAVLSLNSISTF